MRRRRWLYWLLGIIGGIALLGVGLTRLHPPPLILNLSASVPRGLYVVRRVSTLARGMLVLVQPDKPLETLLVARGYLPAGIPLLKPRLRFGRGDGGSGVIGHAAESLGHTQWSMKYSHTRAISTNW